MGKCLFMRKGETHFAPPNTDADVVLLLHGENLIDSSKYRHAISNSNVVVSSEQSKFGGKSLYFDGTAALTIKSDMFNFGQNYFTVDWWEYCTGNSATRFAMSINGGCGGICAGGSHDTNKLYIGSTGTSWNIQNGTAAFSASKNEWVHWAFEWCGNALRTYRNGQMYYKAIALSGSPYWNGAGLVIGSFLYDANHYFQGFIDEFRISNGARWISDEGFAVPTAPY